jgi:hypothetical protein
MAGTFIASGQDDTALTVEAGYNYLRAGEDGIWYDGEDRQVGFGAGEVEDNFIGNRTADPSSAPAGVVGTLTQWFSWITNRIKAIVGTTNWYDPVPVTLTDLANGVIGLQAGLQIQTDTNTVAVPGGSSGEEDIVFSFSTTPIIVIPIVRFTTAQPNTFALNVSTVTSTGAKVQWTEEAGLTPPAFFLDFIAIGVP